MLRIWWLVGVVLVAVGLGALAAQSTVTATIVVSLAIAMAWSIIHRVSLLYSLAFLTAAFPKAGVKIGDFPFPIFLFGLVFAVMLVASTHRRARIPSYVPPLLIATATFLAYRVTWYLDEGLQQVFAFLAWTSIPLSLLILSSYATGVTKHYRNAFEIGFLASVGYALLQFRFGIEEVAIPGLTYAMGDDLSQKNNVIYSTIEDFSKIPSTYQNGNIYGLVSAVFLVMATVRVVERRGTTLDYLVALAAALAVTLSGSRTAIVAASVPLGLLMLQRGNTMRKFALSTLVLGVAAAAVALQNGLLTRYTVDDVVSTGGAGRFEQWQQSLIRLSTAEWFLGSSDRSYLPEGWAGIVVQLGVVGSALLIGSVLVLTRNRPGWGLGLLVLAIGATVDSSYLLFPTWFLAAAMMAVPESRNVAVPLLSTADSGGRSAVSPLSRPPRHRSRLGLPGRISARAAIPSNRPTTLGQESQPED